MFSSGPKGGDHNEKQNNTDPSEGEPSVNEEQNKTGPSERDHSVDHCSLSDYHITSGSTVQVMLCLRGGSKNERGSEEGKYCDHKNLLSDSEVGDPSERPHADTEDGFDKFRPDTRGGNHKNFSGSKSGDLNEKQKKTGHK